MENLVEQLKQDILNLQKRKFKDLPTEQDIFKTEKEWEENKKRIILKWEKEIKTLQGMAQEISMLRTETDLECGEYLGENADRYNEEKIIEEF